MKLKFGDVPNGSFISIFFVDPAEKIYGVLYNSVKATAKVGSFALKATLNINPEPEETKGFLISEESQQLLKLVEESHGIDFDDAQKDEIGLSKALSTWEDFGIEAFDELVDGIESLGEIESLED